MFKTICLLGVNVSRVNPAIAVRQIFAWVKDQQRTYVCVAPVATLVDANRDVNYREAVNAAGMVTPDGMPVVWLARTHGCQDIERTYGPDMMLAVCDQGQELGLKHFFYGASQEVLKELEQRLLESYPQIKIVGMHAPAFRKDVWQESTEIIDRMNNAGADIIWVGIGSPKQDFWMRLHRPLLKAPVIIGAGAAFDFCSGIKPQAPRWMMRVGLEWFFRLCSEPRRLWKRYLIGNSLFLFYVIKDSFNRGPGR